MYDLKVKDLRNPFKMRKGETIVDIEKYIHMLKQNNIIFTEEQYKDAILKCQKQNIYWDRLLINFYRKILIFLLIVIIISFFILYWNKSVNNLFLGIISSFSILEIIIKEISMSIKFNSINNEINCIIDTLNRTNSVDINILKELQAKIFARRKSEFNVPSFIHKINRITI